MARIAGVELPVDKRIDYALTLIYGIGWRLSEKILADTKIPAGKRVGELIENEIAQIAKATEDYIVEGDLRRRIKEDIQRLKDIGSYRGLRHSRGLPARGQRTRTNARTKRGARKTVGAFKKETLAKLGIVVKEEETKENKK